MTTQGHAHVVHLDGDGVAAEQAFVQQFDVGAFDEAQFQQAPLQFDLVFLMAAVFADLHDDAAIAASGLAEFNGVGHGARYDDARRRFSLVVDSDYQLRTVRVQRPLRPNAVRPMEGAWPKEIVMQAAFPRPARAFVPAVALTLVLGACGNASETANAPDAQAQPAPAEAPAGPSAADKAVLLAALPAPYNEGDLDNGRRAFARCRSCHTITPGGPNMTGPNLYGVFGSQAGTHEKYNYSTALKQAGFTWDADKLDHWLQNPRTFLPGNKMSFAGLPDAADRRDIIAFLKVETGYKPTE